MTTTIVDRRNGISEGVAVKLACRVATTANITLSGLQSIDGVTVAADDRVLVKDQTDASENGVYVVASGAWSRAEDFDGNRDIVEYTRIQVIAGSTGSGEYYLTASDEDIVIGESDLTFTTISSSIAADSITYAKIQNVSATDRLLGRDTAGAGDIEELTVSGGVEFTGTGGIQRSALTGDVTASAGSNSTTIANDAVTYAKMQNVSATDRILGRDTAGAGDAEELTVGGGLEFTGSGGIQRSALTGDVTASAGSNSTTIANDAVTYAKLQDVAASDRILGRITSGAGDAEELTAANVRTIINVEDGADVTDATNVAAAGAVMEADTSTASMSFVVDEDNMVSDSATKVPTQQSVKAYVDTHVADTTTHGTTGNIVGTSDSQTLTNKTIDADSNTLSNLEVADFKASAIVTEAEGLASSDNDTSIPTTAAVKDYVDDSIVASGGGDMLSSTYDPQAIEADAFDVDNHTDGTTNKVFSATEQTKLAGIETAADVTDATNVAAAGAVMEADTSTASMSFVIDEDDMSSDSATKVPTQQSVKAYVDAEVAGAGGVADIVREARTSNTILGTADKGKLIEITSGTFSQTFTAAATLGSGWFVYIYNSGSGDITLDPNSTEQIDGLVTYIMYPGESRLITCDGSAFYSSILKPFTRTWTATAASGFTKPPGYLAFGGLLWGGGGAGGRNSSTSGSGGGGGACVPLYFPSSTLGATENVTIGAAVSGRGTDGTGNSGNNSTFSVITAYAGAGGSSTNGGGGGGSMGAGTTAGAGGAPAGGKATSDQQDSGLGGGGAPGGDPAGKAFYGGGSGGSTDRDGGVSVYGGGGGGGADNNSAGTGATSNLGGAGGTGSVAGTATSGTAPAGGGGGSFSGTSGGGARGELRLWGIV